MSGRVHVEHIYAASPDAVWDIALDFEALADLSAGSVTYRGLPAGRVAQGDMIDFEVSPFGPLPWKPYRVEMVEVDHDARRFVSLEHGAGVKTWRHTLTVVPEGEGARQIDEIEIDAGWMTPVIVRLARRMYAKRDSPRRRLLGLMSP